MDTSLRPHRGGIILGLGIAGLLTAFLWIPLGVIAGILGLIDLRRMRDGKTDPSGRTTTQVGMVLGFAGTAIWMVVAVFVVLSFFFLRLGDSRGWTSDSDHPGIRHATERYAAASSNMNEWPRKSQYDETLLPNGQWVKSGHYIHWLKDGTTAEEGEYLNGQRVGQWTFRDDKGKLDTSRSGYYEADKRVHD